MSTNFAVIIYWSYLPRLLSDKVYKHYFLKDIFFGEAVFMFLIFQANIKK